jgi:maltose alpha-D-glucosyltransferase/alpha-amylase
VANRVNSLSDADRALGNSLVAKKADLASRIKALFPRSTKAKRTRLHGDLHLGQTLITQGDVYIVDFEGEPMRPLTERRGKFLPLRDVAGMLRSFEYASAAATRDTKLSAESSSTFQRLTSRLKAGFLLAYAEAIVGCVSFPEDTKQADNFLELCLIEKALYEVRYEIANRPAWVDIPVAGLLAAIDGKTRYFGHKVAAFLSASFGLVIFPFLAGDQRMQLFTGRGRDFSLGQLQSRCLRQFAA